MSRFEKIFFREYENIPCTGFHTGGGGGGGRRALERGGAALGRREAIQFLFLFTRREHVPAFSPFVYTCTK